MKKKRSEYRNRYMEAGRKKRVFVPIEGEEWRQVASWPDYEASNLGRIRSNRYPHEKFLMKLRADPNGYWRCGVIRQDKRSSQYLVHRLVAEAFLGPSNGLTVNHKDGNPSNSRIENLEYLTQKENVHHAIRMGLFPTKYERGVTKLNPEKVRRIRALYDQGFTVRQIMAQDRFFKAMEFSAIWKAASRQTWTEVV